MRNKLLFGFTAIAVVCMAFAVMLLTPNTAVVRAETVSGKTPTFSATKYLKSSDGSMMLLATGINDYDDCYECGYEIEGLQAVTYNTAKYYTSISAGGGAKTWTTEDIFGEEYDGMIVWEVKNISTETTFRPYVRVGDREDGVLVSSETVEYGTERSIDSVVGITASYTGILLSEGLDDFASSGKALTFEYKATGASSGTDTVVFTLRTADGTQRLTGIYTLDVEANTLSGSAAKIEDIGDDWFRVTINCSDMPINTAEGADGTETIGQIFFNTVNRPVIIAYAEFVDEDIHIGAHNFTTSASTYDFGASPSTSGVELDQVIIIDVKFATSGNFNFYLNEYYNPRYCGPFAVTSAGAVSGNGASIESIDGGWYRVKINLNKATKGGDPAFISRVNIQAGTATGYVKYIGYEEPDIHEDKVSFAASTAKDYYFVENYSTEGVALDKTILIDVKFTSAGTFVFYLNEYYYGRYCGPFTVNSNGTVSGAGASIESIDDGWYRVTIDIASTAKSATNPAFLSRINITNGGTGAGYVKYIGVNKKTVTVVGGTGGGTYEEGESVTVTATMPEDKRFVEWRVDGVRVSADESYTFTLTEDLTLTAIFKVEYDFPSLTVAVFADVQLADENKGNTRNAYLALKNHLKYAKSINADVVLMPGDIVNNAKEEYYENYEKAIKAVYGADESVYPEFILCMGNHEWWDLSENETTDAVSLFNEYARIETSNLVRRTSITYYKDGSAALPTYYKVIKGIPFLVVSGENSKGQIDDALKDEIADWLEEISELPSVKAGGPIYVAYHYPIPNVTYNGEATNPVCGTIDELFSDYHSAIVFTGDTHFNGINERTINQTEYTSINLGSSSYSRNMSVSATGYQYGNVNLGSGKNLLNDEVGFKFEYTPNILVASLDEWGRTVIDRYFSADDVENVKNVGITWTIDPDYYFYTDDRIGSTAWANNLYGKDGLTWTNGKTVKFNVESGKMIVKFDDVSDHNFAEHYRIKVEDSSDSSDYKFYDFSGNYYKFDDDSHTYRFILTDLPSASGYRVTVTAYDFFDNPSLNYLTSSVEDETLAFPDESDVQAAKTYCDASKRVNYDITTEGSNSSLEYYYRGVSSYSFGMGICQIIYKNNVSMENYLSVTDWSNATVTLKVKNPNDFDIYLGLATVIYDGNGTQKWLDDFKSTYRVRVAANSDWTLVQWDLNDIYKNEANYMTITAENICRIGLKAAADQSVVDTEDGYEMTFYIDDIDITDSSGGIEEPQEEEPIIPTWGGYIDLPSTISSYTSSSKYLTFKIKKVNDADSGVIAFMLSDGSTNSFGIRINLVSNGVPTNNRACASIEDLGDGWYLITTQTCEQIGGSAFNATKLMYSNGYPSKQFYFKDLRIIG